MDSKEKEIFLVNAPVSEKEKEYCLCRTAYGKSNHTFPMVASNACDEWYHGDGISFTHTFVHAIPFFVCPNCIDMYFGGYFFAYTTSCT